MGPPALLGTVPTGLTIVYANPGTANASTTGCTFNDLQGWPSNLLFSHNSDFVGVYSAPGDPESSANGGTTPYVLSRNLNFVNSVFVNGGIYATFGEGTRTETKAFDPTTLGFNNILMPGRDSVVVCPGHTTAGAGGAAACYTEYPSGLPAGTTDYLVPSSNCNGNDPVVENCSGILGAMSSSSFPAVLNDWHQYRLCHVGDASCNGKASVYAAAQAEQGSDGLDLGFNPASIDTAEISNQYVCAGYCGPTGPFRDH